MSLIPAEVWDGECLHLPPCLKSHYEAELRERNLYELALGPAVHFGHGGQSEEDTTHHFTKAFPSSSGRVLYAVHAPEEDFAEISDTLLQILSYGHVSILDVACGTGAMSASLLTALIHLRRKNVLPKLPLNVSICGADYSTRSLEVFECLMGRLSGEALEVGIRLDWTTIDWDATVGYDTARMIRAWESSGSGASDHLVFVNNFSGALKNEATFQAFSPNFHNILSSLYDKQGAVVWLEPLSENKKVKLIARLADLIGKFAWWRGAKADRGNEEGGKARYHLGHPFEDRFFLSDVHVHYFSRYSPEMK